MTETQHRESSADMSAPVAPEAGHSRRVPRSMWFLTCAWTCLLLGASLVWPMTYGYDETPHVDMAYAYAAHPFRFYAPGELKVSQAALGIYRMVPAHPPRRRFAEVPVLRRGERPTFAELGGHGATTGPINQMVQHPPLYYELVALVIRIPGVSHLPWDVEIWVMRLVSVLLMLPIPLLCWAAARRLLASSMPRGTPRTTIDRLSMAAAVIPFTLPNLIRDGSSVTNDALLISAVSVLLYLLCRVVTSDLTLRTAVGVSATLAAALLTKGFALVLPPIVLGAYIIGWLRQGRMARRTTMALVSPVAVAAVGGIVGGLWWMRNLLRFGTVQPLGVPHTFHQVGPPAVLGHLKRFVPTFTSELSERIWGGVGYADQPRITPVVTFGFLVVVAVGMILSLTQTGARGTRWPNLFLLSTVGLTFLVVAYGSFDHYRYALVAQDPRAAQGRYLYQAIVLVAPLATIGWFAVLQPRIRPLVTPIVLGAGILVNVAVWSMVLRVWYAPVERDDMIRKSLDGFHSLLRFSPLPSLVTVAVVVVLPVLACAAAVVTTIRDARDLRRDDEWSASSEPDPHAAPVPADAGVG